MNSTRTGGRRSQSLSDGQRARLKTFWRDQRDFSWPKVLASMTAPPFGLKSLLRAADGGRISEKNHAWLSAWLDRYLPGAPEKPAIDRKRAAAGDHSLENGEPLESAASAKEEATRRGSR